MKCLFPMVGDICLVQNVYDYTDGIDFVLAFYDGYGIEPDSDGTVSASVMESENPTVTQFIVKAKK